VVGYTKRKREITRERYNKKKREKYYYPKNKKEVVRRETHPPLIFIYENV
jgi:hypothetical protein